MVDAQGAYNPVRQYTDLEAGLIEKRVEHPSPACLAGIGLGLTGILVLVLHLTGFLRAVISDLVVKGSEFLLVIFVTLPILGLILQSITSDAKAMRLELQTVRKEVPHTIKNELCSTLPSLLEEMVGKVHAKIIECEERAKKGITEAEQRAMEKLKALPEDFRVVLKDELEAASRKAKADEEKVKEDMKGIMHGHIPAKKK